jgi:hypothetical protein
MKRAFVYFTLAGLTGIACSAIEEEDDQGLAPPLPGEGLQYKMVSELGPGVETERCHFFVAPPEGLYVHRQQVKFTPGSHHVLLFTTPYTEIPKKDRFGNDVDTSGVFECGKSGPTAHWDVDGVAGGSQTAHGPPIIEDLPADTAVFISGGRILLMNTHYLNASTKPLVTDARINLYTIPKDQAKREAGFVFFYNPFIRIDPMSTAEARGVCPVLEDVYLVNAQSHMHKRGVDFVAHLVDAGGKAVDTLYQGTEWEEVVMKRNQPHKLLAKGQGIDYKCGYDNKEMRTVTQGLGTEDEMCMFVGLYYPRNRQFELCGLNDKWQGAFMAARWIGSGTQNGIQTLDCFMNAKPRREDDGESFFGCVVNSCPNISTQMSNAARCLATEGLGQCAAECKEDPAVCRQCFVPKCMPALGALVTAKCE